MSRASRGVVLATLVLVGSLVVVLVLASLAPSEALAARLFGAAGETRSGSYTQDLIAYLGERLRLAAGLLVVCGAGLVLLRAPFADLVQATIEARIRPGWPPRAELLAIGAAGAVAVALRLAFINQPMRYDESLTFNEFGSRPLYYGLSFYPDPNNHLLNTLLVHVAVAGLGNHPWVLRLPAFVAGVLLAPATYALTRLLCVGRAAPFLAALLVAGSSYLVEYSTNSRGYTLQALCFVVMLGLVTLAARRDNPAALLLAVLFGAVGAYAVPTMLYGVVVAAAWFAVQAQGTRPQRIGWGQVTVSGLVLGLLVVLAYLPVIVVSGADKLVSNRFVVPLNAPELLAELPDSLLRTWILWQRDVPLPLAGALLIGFGVATIAEVRQRRAPLGLLAAAVCLVLVLLQRVAPFERVWLFLLPLYLGIASAGVIRLGAVRFTTLATWFACLFAVEMAVATLTSGAILSSSETGTFADAQDVARALSNRIVPGDAVLTTLPASLPELQYYFPTVGLPIDSLVRPPAEAQHLYVVAAPEASPTVTGWASPRLIERFPDSVLLALQRS